MTSGTGRFVPRGTYRSSRWPRLPAGSAGAYAMLVLTSGPRVPAAWTTLGCDDTSPTSNVAASRAAGAVRRGNERARTRPVMSPPFGNPVSGRLRTSVGCRRQPANIYAAGRSRHLGQCADLSGDNEAGLRPSVTVANQRQNRDVLQVKPRAAIVAGAALSVFVLVGLLASGQFDRVPLLRSALAVVVESLAAIALAVAWTSRGPGWLTRRLPVVILTATAVTLSIAAALRLTGPIPDASPPSFLLWFGMAFAALVGLPVLARRAGRTRRWAAVLAIPLTLGGGF